MKTATKSEKALSKQVDDAFRRLGNRVQFDMMDLGKIDRETKASVAQGMSVDDAMQQAVTKYRKN